MRGRPFPLPRREGAARLALRIAAGAVLLAVLTGGPVGGEVQRWLAQAEEHARAGDPDAAAARYHRALARLGPAAPLYDHLAHLSLDARQFGAAQVFLYRAADLDGWTPERRRVLLAALEGQGDAVAARAVAQGLLEGQGDDPLAALAVAEAQLERGEWDAARAALERVAAANPADHRARYLLGALLAPVAPDRAAPYLEAALADPTQAGGAAAVLAALDGFEQLPLTDAQTRVGLALVGVGDWALAEHALLRALERDSVNPTARGYLGFVRGQQGRDGLPDLEAALAIAPNDATLYYLLGLHWRAADDPESAYVAFAQARALDPDNPALAVELGAAAQALGDLAEAEGWYDRAVALAPDDVRWQGLRAAFYADSEVELDAARLAAIESAAARAPGDPDVRASLGWAYYRTGALEQAYDELSAAVQLDPNRPRSRYYFAVMLERLGDRQGAADSYRFVVEQVGTEGGYGLLASRALARLGAF